MALHWNILEPERPWSVLEISGAACCHVPIRRGIGSFAALMWCQRMSFGPMLGTTTIGADIDGAFAFRAQHERVRSEEGTSVVLICPDSFYVLR